MRSFQIAVLLLCFATLYGEAADPVPSSEEKKVVCYFTTWSHKRVFPYDFTPDSIDPFLCTHIIYAFVGIGSNNNLVTAEHKYDIDQRAYANITGLKKRNKNLKVMISIGGWKEGTKAFGVITANETNRKEFARNAVHFMRWYMFDGIDLNWQHPTIREGGIPEDKVNYVLLASALREEFDREAAANNKPPLLLSIAISHNMNFLPAYDIASFNNYMDFISVICYDYHFSYETNINHHSPLYSVEESEYNIFDNINANYTINYFMELADPGKLVLGIPTYGRTYRLENPEETTLGSPADGAGTGGPITQERGWFAYFEICNFIENEGWTVMQTKPGSAGPYAYKGDQWVCFDDLDMIRTKAAYAKQKGLGGVMFWTIDYDDFLGRCSDGRFPIIRAARDELNPNGQREPEELPEEPTPRPVISPSIQPVVIPTNNQEDDSLIDMRKPKPTPPAIRPVLPSYSSPPPNPPSRPRTPSPPSYPITPSPPSYPSPLPNPPSRPRTPSAPSYPNPPPNPPSRPRIPSPPNYPLSPELEPSQPEYSAVSKPETNIVADLLHLIEGAGGMKNFCKMLREIKKSKMSGFYQSKQVDDGNSIILETEKLPPILVVLSNSSIFIKEVKIYS